MTSVDQSMAESATATEDEASDEDEDDDEEEGEEEGEEEQYYDEELESKDGYGTNNDDYYGDYYDSEAPNADGEADESGNQIEGADGDEDATEDTVAEGKDGVKTTVAATDDYYGEDYYGYYDEE